ncbi:hypothetical protein ABE494_11710 [Stenotrophomonas lactitubi]|uniref:hypothetical protein n=1 Tax=Stenotrophomonas lactitubi TaxID=2045214 RepID=UPI00320A3762
MRAARAVVASVVLVLLVGCGSTSSPEAPKLLTRAEADARTVVPFTRGVRLEKAGRIVDVTFEAPAAVDPQMSWLKLGLRMQGAEQKAVSEAAERLRRAEFQTRIHLERVDMAKPSPIPLSRSSDDGRGWQKLPQDGRVERLFQDSVDAYPLEQAGLHSQDMFYEVLQIADAGLIDPGRYRVTVDIVEDRPEFEGMQVEFIAAYYSLGK